MMCIADQVVVKTTKSKLECGALCKIISDCHAFDWQNSVDHGFDCSLINLTEYHVNNTFEEAATEMGSPIYTDLGIVKQLQL
jgi:hypothetical protein